MSLRVWGFNVEVHKCICLVILGMNNVPCSLDPDFLPSSLFKIVEFMMRVEDYRTLKSERKKKNKTTCPWQSYKPQSGWSCHNNS